MRLHDHHVPARGSQEGMGEETESTRLRPTKGRQTMNQLEDRVAKAALTGLMVAMASLAAEEARSASLYEVTMTPVAYQMMETSQQGEFSAPALVLANSAAEWDRAMQMLENRGGLMVTPPRSGKDLVDWSSQAVILVALGSYPNEQYVLDVTQVRSRGTQLLVTVQIGLNNPTEQAMTSPYEIVTIPRGTWKSAQAEYGPQGGAGFAQQSLSVDAAMQAAVTWGGVKGLYR
jgi:hypothetical protein